MNTDKTMNEEATLIGEVSETGRYGLPLKVEFCAKCVISNQRPSCVVEWKNSNNDKKPTNLFDQNGVCDACRYAEVKDKIEWSEREKEFQDLLDRHRKKDGSYDCIVPSSGGKDSCYVAHQLKYKYKMNPLTVTWAPHFYTDVGWKNLQSFIHAGFDNMLFTPNGKVHRILTRLAFENLCHPFQPFIIGQKGVAPKTALAHNIPLIFYGENPAEYGGNAIESNKNSKMDLKFFSRVETDINKIFLGGMNASELMQKEGINKSDLAPYLMPNQEEIEKKKIEVHFCGYFFKWDPQENYYYAVKNCGFQGNTERTEGSYSKYSGIDDRIDYFHFYTSIVKFGIGRATHDAAQEIRNNKITREEGISLVRRYDAEFPKKYFKDFIEYIDLTEDRFWEIIDEFRTPHLWEKSNGEWKLKYQVS